MIRWVKSDEDMIAYAWSFFWIKRIVTGKRFEAISPRLRAAIILHERGHANLHHTEKKLLALLITPWKLFRVIKEQEFEADAYCASRRFGNELIEFLQTLGKGGGHYHPTNAERIDRLLSLRPRQGRISPDRRNLAQEA